MARKRKEKLPVEVIDGEVMIDGKVEQVDGQPVYNPTHRFTEKEFDDSHKEVISADVVSGSTARNAVINSLVKLGVPFDEIGQSVGLSEAAVKSKASKLGIRKSHGEVTNHIIESVTEQIKNKAEQYIEGMIKRVEDRLKALDDEMGKRLLDEGMSSKTLKEQAEALRILNDVQRQNLGLPDKVIAVDNKPATINVQLIQQINQAASNF